MSRRIWIIVFVLINVSHGRLPTLEHQKAQFLQLELKIEFTIAFHREDIVKEANKLDPVLDHFHDLMEKRAKITKHIVTHKQHEARALNHSISHCVRGIKILSKNMDLYNLHQCKEIPHHIDDNVLEAKKLSLSIHKQKTDCILKHSSCQNRVRLCLKRTLEEINKKQLRMFRVIKTQKEGLLKNGLNCIQDNYNILVRELCMLTCHFEECVAKKCKPREPNQWILDKPQFELLL